MSGDNVSLHLVKALLILHLTASCAVGFEQEAERRL